MKEIILLFFFNSSFLLIIWIFYYIFMFDKKMQKRMNYYFEIDKKLKSKIKKEDKITGEYKGLKGINEAIRGKLSNLNQGKVDQYLRSAGVGLTSEEYIMLKWFLSATIGGILYFLTNNIILLLPGGIVGYIIPKFWVDRKSRIRVKKYNDGLADMITTMIGSLRSGYSFAQALKTVSEECESPIKEETELLLKEMSYGINMEEALSNLSKRVPSSDLDIMIQAILIQRQVGGNLTGVLEIIVKTIRERNKIYRQVHTLTSQGRLSGRVIGAMPVVVGGGIYLITPDYINVLFTNTIGIIIMVYGVISGIIGFVLINKLTKIEV